MTNEEAIAIFEEFKVIDDWTMVHLPPMEDAINKAIEALKILGDDGIVNCCGCINWKTDGGAMMMCELWDTPMGDFDYCSYGKRSEESEVEE